VRLIEADFDEVIAAAQTAQLHHPVIGLGEVLGDIRVFGRDAFQPLVKRLGSVVERGLVGVPGHADRHVATDLIEHLAQ